MLRNTFCHISGIGEKSEKRLWDQGIQNWEDFFNCKTLSAIPKKELIRRNLETSMAQLSNRNPSYFESALPPSLHWRLFPEFRKKTAYLDIETTGLDFFNEITSIALYDGQTIRYYVNGKNLDDFMDDILAYTVIVTYNGKCFDIPFIQRFFNIRMTQAHIDLRYVLRSLGFSGGLKRCERQMGIDRGELTGIDGFFAVLLWEDYVGRGNEKALETLLAYNIEDVVNLEVLMIKAYNLKIAGTPFQESHRIAEPESPAIPFKAHPDTVERIKSRFI